MLGIALYWKYEINVELAISTIKHILKKPIYINDLSDIDSELTKNLIWFLNNSVTEDLGITFSYSKFHMGKQEIIDLIPNG